MSLYVYLGIKFWFEVISTIIVLTAFAIWLIGKGQNKNRHCWRL